MHTGPHSELDPSRDSEEAHGLRRVPGVTEEALDALRYTGVLGGRVAAEAAVAVESCRCVTDFGAGRSDAVPGSGCR
ncbi:MAG: hypothetical protein KF791_07150 [Verrucomicrobiae bacterium]|nr:hypothetical protein [Verrucomicrobiae bacterium]